jgi:hypothetical protein
MELQRWKTRIAVLWVIKAMAISVFMVLYFVMPGGIEEIMSGQFEGMQISEGVLFYIAGWYFIPWIMAWLSLTLKDKANRWTNFVLGILFAILIVYGLIDGAMGGQSAAIVVDYFLDLVFTVLIICYAWKWPKQED